jgi:hypothetical protein
MPSSTTSAQPADTSLALAKWPSPDAALVAHAERLIAAAMTRQGISDLREVADPVRLRQVARMFQDGLAREAREEKVA